MTPIRSRRALFVRGCMLLAVGVGIIASTAQAQHKPATERQLAAGRNMAPLKLPPLPPNKVSTKNFGDWTQRCDTRPGVPEQKCFLTQTVVKGKDQRKHGLMAITVGLFGPDRKPGMILRVPLGLGVFLPPGFKLNVPGIEPTQIVIHSCLPAGCIARTPLSPNLIAAMKNADAGSLKLHTITKRLVQVPVSFKGFTAALASLSKR